MLNFNKVILMGHLTGDPKHTVFEDGKEVTNFSIASNRTWKDDSGTQREEACFVDCKIFGNRARTIANNCYKGRPLFVEGHLYLEKWNDKNTGAPRQKLRVVVESFEFVDKKEGSGSTTDNNYEDFDSCEATMAGCDDFEATINSTD